jgi:hypothetical protein
VTSTIALLLGRCLVVETKKNIAVPPRTVQAGNVIGSLWGPGDSWKGTHMTKFLVLYRANQSASEQMAGATPDEQQAGMAEWMNWANRAGTAIVDLGSPLTPAADTAVSGDSIGGFSILQAASAEELRSVLEGHPHTAHGGTIEVHEFLPIPGM